MRLKRGTWIRIGSFGAVLILSLGLLGWRGGVVQREVRELEAERADLEALIQEALERKWKIDQNLNQIEGDLLGEISQRKKIESTRKDLIDRFRKISEKTDRTDDEKLFLSGFAETIQEFEIDSSLELDLRKKQLSPQAEFEKERSRAEDIRVKQAATHLRLVDRRRRFWRDVFVWWDSG